MGFVHGWIREYRGLNFQSSADIEILVNKTIRKKQGDAKTIAKTDFDIVLLPQIDQTNPQNSGERSARKELESMVGMHDIKRQLERLTKRMQMIKQRKDHGYQTSVMHLAACFLGNPGTNKTTTARLFGKLLLEEHILANDAFVEVSRKDLVGQYVGWTAPTVARVFAQAKGGTLFIDEAYSLMNEGTNDGYSDEALAEIIRQMEDNPDTLVIFAGYSDEMKKFIRKANPGLRSRLTNLLEFKDYSIGEMWEIFRYFLQKEEYELEDIRQTEAAINQTLTKLKGMQKENLGNGRLMRKIFNTAIGYMSERDDHDYRTLKVADIEQALQEIVDTEGLISQEQLGRVQIGFHL